jgi:hypothetical protein
MRVLCLDPGPHGTCGRIVLRDRLAGRHLKAVVSRSDKERTRASRPSCAARPVPALDVLDPADPGASDPEPFCSVFLAL